MSPLHDACVARDLTGVQVALRAGYKVDAPNDAGITPLMCAAVVNCAETVKELLEFGASVSATDRKGWTALHYCAKSGTLPVAKLLLAFGADVLVTDKEKKSPYDLACTTSNLAIRALLRPHTVGALRSDTVGAAMERQRIASELGLKAALPVVPGAVSGENTSEQLRKAEEAQAAYDTILAPPQQMHAFMLPTRLDAKHIHDHLLPMHQGSERVLLMEARSDKARWLGCVYFEVLNNLQRGKVDCSLCCWGAARPRAYVRITENSLEINRVVVMCPCDFCVFDNPDKVLFDKMVSVAPFRARCCSPYNWCCGCLEPCGQTAVLAPHKCLARESCLCMFPCCYRFVPGLVDADEFVDFLRAAQADFFERKMAGHEGGFCGCFHKKGK